MIDASAPRLARGSRILGADPDHHRFEQRLARLRRLDLFRSQAHEILDFVQAEAGSVRSGISSQKPDLIVAIGLRFQLPHEARRLPRPPFVPAQGTRHPWFQCRSA